MADIVRKRMVSIMIRLGYNIETSGARERKDVKNAVPDCAEEAI